MQPIFFPCYLVAYQYQGQQLVGAVSAVDGQVSTQRLYSPLKAGAASAALLWSLGLVAATHSSVWMLASGLMAAAVAYIVRYIPLLGVALQQVAHARDVAQLQLEDHTGAAEELRRGERGARQGGQRRGQQQRWQEEEEQAEQQGWSDYGVGAGPFVFWRSAFLTTCTVHATLVTLALPCTHTPEPLFLSPEPTSGVWSLGRFRQFRGMEEREMMREFERMVREAAYQYRRGGAGAYGGRGSRVCLTVLDPGALVSCASARQRRMNVCLHRTMGQGACLSDG